MFKQVNFSFQAFIIIIIHQPLMVLNCPKFCFTAPSPQWRDSLYVRAAGTRLGPAYLFYMRYIEESQ